jgi:thiamine-phosphate diphosphorylase/hydroxyethylthiazole kinase
VDSIGSGFADPARVVKQLALREREYEMSSGEMHSPYTITGCIIVMTGPDDWISDGDTVIKLSNGHPLLAAITASGCIVGTTVATFCGAVNMVAREQGEVPAVDLGNGRLVQGDMLVAAVAGSVLTVCTSGTELTICNSVLAITIAGEIAAERVDVRGPGTFLPALIDELAVLTPEDIMHRAKVMQVF